MGEKQSSAHEQTRGANISVPKFLLMYSWQEKQQR